MATVYGVGNHWLARLVAKRAAALGVYGAILSGTVICAAVYDVRLAAAVFVAGIAFARRRRGLSERYRYAEQGARGEQGTAEMLALLPAGFTVMNDLPFDGFNVDHVVVGPTGVWAIETKSQAGLVQEHVKGVWLNGRRMYRDPRRQARAAAATIAELIQRGGGARCWVEALVCFPNATVAANKKSWEACVVSPGQLLGRLRLSSNRLVPAERSRVVDVLMRAKEQPSVAPLAPAGRPHAAASGCRARTASRP